MFSHYKCNIKSCIKNKAINFHKVMRKLAKLFGCFWAFSSIVPTSTFVKVIGDASGLDAEKVASIQIPFIVFQAFSLLITILYPKDVFDLK